jgi:hypothetical protein
MEPLHYTLFQKKAKLGLSNAGERDKDVRTRLNPSSSENGILYVQPFFKYLWKYNRRFTSMF